MYLNYAYLSTNVLLLSLSACCGPLQLESFIKICYSVIRCSWHLKCILLKHFASYEAFDFVHAWIKKVIAGLMNMLFVLYQVKLSKVTVKCVSGSYRLQLCICRVF